MNEEKVDPYFLHSFLRSQLGQTILISMQKVTAQPTLGTSDLALLEVPYPDPVIQRAIGNKVRKAERLRETGERALRRAESTIDGLKGTFSRSKQRTSWLDSDGLQFARLDAEFYQPHFLAADAWIESHPTESLASLMLSGSYGVLPDSADYGPATCASFGPSTLGISTLRRRTPFEFHGPTPTRRAL
ncbi:hypothetical protein [Thiocapsa imhoffii]|uniref:hypothetical protein n=1 Tax=Thiocapsa imhoffii TaxID=382777 RepID=UPI001908994F|nr:hypothetical protein [Thiocapsa imhoffii]